MPVADLLKGLTDALAKKGQDTDELDELRTLIGTAQEGWEIEATRDDFDEDDDRPSLSDLRSYCEPEDIEDAIVEQLESIYGVLGLPTS